MNAAIYDQVFTLNELASALGESYQPEQLGSIIVGMMVQFHDTSPAGQQLPFQSYVTSLEAHWRSGNCALLFDGLGEFCSYISWVPQRSASELLVREFYCPQGNLAAVLRRLRTSVFSGAHSVTYVRTRRGSRVAKRICSGDNSALVRRPVSPRDYPVWPGEVPPLARFDVQSHTRAVLRQALAMGHAMRLAACSESLAKLSMRDAVGRLQTPMSLGQYQLWEDSHHAPVALATWAHTADPVHFAVQLASVQKLAPEAWNEGDRPVMVDLFNRNGPLLAAKIAPLAR